MQFIPTEEGRAQIKRDSSAIVYDYMIKDHLGNVRMLLTEETDTAFYPPATFETANESIEIQYCYEAVPGISNLTKTAARVWEQGQINTFGLQKNGGQLLNKINSIAPQRWIQFGVQVP